MLKALQLLVRFVELVVVLPWRAARLLFTGLLFNPRLGRLRFLTAPLALYLLFAFTLVYVYAPLRGLAGQLWMGKALRYADERSLGTAIHDRAGRFVGIFDPLMDSEEDFNYTGRTIELPGYIAYPDHKSLHIGQVPPQFWRCLMYQEDRHLGTWLNPSGIDLIGVLKIPYSTVERSIAERRLALGSGGSTLAMQLARIFVKTPPSRNESAVDKLGRKLTEWWLAPVLQWELTRGGDIEPLQRWAANHFPLAQRTGGQALYGLEQTSLIVFGKNASELTVAQQYVLAAAVNRPIILLAGSDALNARREASWRHIVGVRANACAQALIGAPDRRAAIVAELGQLAQSPPEPHAPEAIATLLAEFDAKTTGPARANPIRRSNALIPAAKYAVREEIKSRFGFGWRAHVRGVEITLDVAENLRFREMVLDRLAALQKRFGSRIDTRYSLDVAAVRSGRSAALTPDIVIAAADRSGAVVRYFESNYTAAYFGSALARSSSDGSYDPERETRFIASIAKMAAAVAVANEGTDAPDSGYLDVRAPTTGLEACGKGEERRLRRADVSFACSLNAPLEWRLAQIAPSTLDRTARAFGLTGVAGGPPIAKALAIGQLAASPRTVQAMAATVLAALTDGERPIAPPTFVRRLAGPLRPAAVAAPPTAVESPIQPRGRALLRTLLSGPICYRHGTLRRIGDWCASRRDDVRLHFAKTGTRGTGALDDEAYDTVDLWVAGGIEFARGAAYSYVVLVGTGNPSRPWARDLYAGAVSEPLLRVLLEDLADDAQPGTTTAAAAAPAP